MIKRDYFRELQELRNDVINDIKYLLRNNNNEIKIPFYYEEDEEVEDIVEFHDDKDFDFKEGDPYNNFTIKVEDEWSRIGEDCALEVDVLKVYLNPVGQICITAKERISNIDDVEDMRELVRLYEKLYEIVSK